MLTLILMGDPCSWSAWSRDINVAWPTFAVLGAAHHYQTVLVGAPRRYGTQSSKSTITCLVDIRHTSRARLRCSCKQPTLWDATTTRLKIAERCSLLSGPAARNSLSLQDVRDHQAFKRNLNTELFNHVYTTCFVCYALRLLFIV